MPEIMVEADDLTGVGLKLSGVKRTEIAPFRWDEHGRVLVVSDFYSDTVFAGTNFRNGHSPPSDRSGHHRPDAPDEIFVRSFIKRLRSWGASGLNIGHVSSPQLVGDRNSWQGRISSNMNIKWHYLFCISGQEHETVREVILLDRYTKRKWLSFGIMHRLGMRSKDLLIHDARMSFRIRDDGCPDQNSYSIVLDGYLW